MGFRFRKSKNFGPLRVNLSKSGVGWSLGTKGARYTKRADGKTQTTLNIPGTGISYVDVKGKSKSKKLNDETRDINNYANKDINIKDSFYKRGWFMWLMLFILPPIGIILMFLFSNYSKKAKIVLTIIFGLFTIIRFTSNTDNKQLETSKSANNNESESIFVDNSKENVSDLAVEDKKEETKLIGWQNSNGNYYYYDNDGNKKTGWINDNNSYYYLNTSGVMQTGWIQDSDKWYYLNSNGTMAHNTTIDGYYLESNGVMQEKTVVNNSSTTNKSDSTSSFVAASKDATTNESIPANRTVYWTSGGKSYHYNKNCPTLSRSKNILSGDASTCPKNDPCDICVK